MSTAWLYVIAYWLCATAGAASHTLSKPWSRPPGLHKLLAGLAVLLGLVLLIFGLIKGHFIWAAVAFISGFVVVPVLHIAITRAVVSHLLLLLSAVAGLWLGLVVLFRL